MRGRLSPSAGQMCEIVNSVSQGIFTYFVWKKSAKSQNQKPLAVATMIGGVEEEGRLGFPSCSQGSCKLAEGWSHLMSPVGRGYLYPATWRF